MMESRVIKVSRGTPPHRRLSIARVSNIDRDIALMIRPKDIAPMDNLTDIWRKNSNTRDIAMIL